MNDFFSIGRDCSCDIVLHDDSNVISRVHAFLRVRRNGTYTISDQSMNGTFVNGIRITSGVEVPVSRKDIITFAQVEDLDWTLIPNPMKRRRTILFFSMSGLVLVALLLILGYMYRPGPSQTNDSVNIIQDTTIVIDDKVTVEKTEEKPAPVDMEPVPAEVKKTEKKVSDPVEEKAPAVKEEAQEINKDTIQSKKIFDSIY